MYRQLISVFIVFLLLIGTIHTFRSTQSTSPIDRPIIAEIGNTPPNFQLTDLSGNTVTLSQLKGKLIILNFWATWCTYCITETPDLVELARKYKGKSVQFLGINATHLDQLEAIQSFANEYAISYPVLLDQTGDVHKSFQVQSFPTTFIIDPTGTIVWKKLGAVTSPEIERQIQTWESTH